MWHRYGARIKASVVAEIGTASKTSIEAVPGAGIGIIEGQIALEFEIDSDFELDILFLNLKCLHVYLSVMFIYITDTDCTRIHCYVLESIFILNI